MFGVAVRQPDTVMPNPIYSDPVPSVLVSSSRALPERKQATVELLMPIAAAPAKLAKAYLSLAEAAEVLRISKQHLRALIKEGVIPAIFLGRRVLTGTKFSFVVRCLGAGEEDGRRSGLSIEPTAHSDRFYPTSLRRFFRLASPKAAPG